MSKHRITAVHTGLLMLAMCANAMVKSGNIRIVVLDSETHSVSVGDTGVPKNCDAVNFDAYCHNSKTVEITNTLLVQEGDNPPFRISCGVDTKWSRCIALPKGQTFEAKREKRGFLVYYVDGAGKVRKQLYTPVPSEPAGNTPSAETAQTTAPVAVKVEVNGSTPPAPAAELVKCSFSSTPPGAEVTIDGKFVGSTPSVLSLKVGNHDVEVSLPGFVQWKRDLTVSKESELTVNAVLQKVQ
jgi:PEGA domain